jgi:uncharacterized protein
MAQSSLHPAAVWVFRLRGIWQGLLIIIFILWLFGSFFFRVGRFFENGIQIALVTIVAVMVITVIAAEIFARLSYKLWSYEFTSSNLKIERGIIWKKFSNVPYERVQNVDIRRGLLARIFDFSEVYIQTAGFSGAGTEGYIPAVSVPEAEKIRDFLMKNIEKKS